jgi:hypothetical protein
MDSLACEFAYNGTVKVGEDCGDDPCAAGFGACCSIEGCLEILGKVPEDPENLAVADLDHNGIPDLVTGAMNWRLAPGSLEQPAWNDEDATLVIFAGQEKQDGSRTWIECRVREGIAALHHLSLADLDGDGDLDVLGENTGAQPPPARVTPSIQILWNRAP